MKEQKAKPDLTYLWYIIVTAVLLIIYSIFITESKNNWVYVATITVTTILILIIQAQKYDHEKDSAKETSEYWREKFRDESERRLRAEFELRGLIDQMKKAKTPQEDDRDKGTET